MTSLPRWLSTEIPLDRVQITPCHEMYSDSIFIDELLIDSWRCLVIHEEDDRVPGH